MLHLFSLDLNVKLRISVFYFLEQDIKDTLSHFTQKNSTKIMYFVYRTEDKFLFDIEFIYIVIGGEHETMGYSQSQEDV